MRTANLKRWARPPPESPEKTMKSLQQTARKIPPTGRDDLLGCFGGPGWRISGKPATDRRTTGTGSGSRNWIRREVSRELRHTRVRSNEFRIFRRPILLTG